jgi:Oxidoreductase molybdopterin binding domain
MRLIRPSRSQYQLAAFLVSLAAVAASIHSSTARAADQPPEAVLLLQGTLGAPIRITESEFKKLPHVEVEAVDHGGHKGRYSGVPLRVLLDKLDVPRGEKLRGHWLGTYVAVDALDDYRAFFALAELDPGLSDRTIILADMRDGKPLDKRHAPFQVIAPGEKRPARWVYQVHQIRVIDSRAKEK